MKTKIKQILILSIAISILLSLSACDNILSNGQFSTPKFENEEAMYTILNGVWVVDSATQHFYIICQNEKIQHFDGNDFRNITKTQIANTVNIKDVTSLSNLSFEKVLNAITEAILLEAPSYSSIIDPKKGLVTITEGATEHQLIVEAESVSIRFQNQSSPIPLKKLSEAVDLSHDEFEAAFQYVKKAYPVSLSAQWMSPRMFGQLILARETPVQSWILREDSAEATIYTPHEAIEIMSGALMITNEDVNYLCDIHVNSYDPDFKPRFAIIYSPDEGYISVMDRDNYSLNPLRMVRYGAEAVEVCPGTYDNYVDLYNALASEQPTKTANSYSYQLAFGGLSYNLSVGIDGTWAEFTIRADKDVSLSDYLKLIPKCPQCKDSEPKTVFMGGWKEGDLCLRCSGEELRTCVFCNREYLYDGIDDGCCDNCIP